MLSVFVPDRSSMSASTGTASEASRVEIDGLRNELNSLSQNINTSPIGPDVEELKKFTDFLKFRIDSLDTRMSVIEKINGEFTSKINIMEITITALSSLLKKPAAE